MGEGPTRSLFAGPGPSFKSTFRHLGVGTGPESGPEKEIQYFIEAKPRVFVVEVGRDLLLDSRLERLYSS